MEFFRQEYWSGLPFPTPGNILNPGIKPTSPALQADSLLLEQLGNPIVLPEVKSLSRVRFFETPQTAACQAPLSMEFFRQ